MKNKKLRKTVIEESRRLAEAGLNLNSSGNFSVRAKEDGEIGFLITPTGMPYADLKAEDIVFVSLRDFRFKGIRKPSSEWLMHAKIYRKRSCISAVAHTHSPMASVLSCRDEAIPPFHYMTAVSGLESIPCAEYATFGSEELADRCLEALGEQGRACLLSHHGVIACSDSAEGAAALAFEVENLARMWIEIEKLGGCKLISPEEMRKVLKKFESYGQRGK